MELYRDILYAILEKEDWKIILPKENCKLDDAIEMRCYQALAEIKNILENDALTDAECFLRIEKIICVFEKLGNGIEGRHDFG